MQLTYLLKETFVNVRASYIYLQNNKIDYIEAEAFDGVSVSQDLWVDQASPGFHCSFTSYFSPLMLLFPSDPTFPLLFCFSPLILLFRSDPTFPLWSWFSPLILLFPISFHPASPLFLLLWIFLEYPIFLNFLFDPVYFSFLFPLNVPVIWITACKYVINFILS